MKRKSQMSIEMNDDIKRCGWKAELGDAMFVVLAGAGFNLNKL